MISAKWSSCLVELYNRFAELCRRIRVIPSFIARLYLADIFFNSGMAKLDDWSGTLFLFQYEYHVPLVNHVFAAYMSVTLELICPVMLVFGFGTRLASLALLLMSVVINYSYIESAENYYWMLLFSFLMVYGGEKLSVDYWLKYKFLKKH